MPHVLIAPSCSSPAWFSCFTNNHRNHPVFTDSSSLTSASGLTQDSGFYAQHVVSRVNRQDSSSQPVATPTKTIGRFTIGKVSEGSAHNSGQLSSPVSHF